jgi:hypothetical protein
MATPFVPSRVSDYEYDTGRILSDPHRQVTVKCEYCEFPHAPSANKIGKYFNCLEEGSVNHLGGVPHRLCEWNSLFDNDPRVEPGLKLILSYEKFEGNKTHFLYCQNDVFFVKQHLEYSCGLSFKKVDLVLGHKMLSKGRKYRKDIDPRSETLYAPNTFWDCLNPEAMPCRVALRVNSGNNIYIATFIGIGETWINKPCDLIVIRGGNVIEEHTVPLKVGDLVNIESQEQEGQSRSRTKWGNSIPGSKIVNVGIYSKRDSGRSQNMYSIVNYAPSAWFMHEGQW